MCKYPETIKVNVTKRDIYNGQRMASGSCPIAKALERKGFKFITVGWSHTYLTEFHKYINPLEARCFVRRFDKGHTVTPFSFTLERVY